MPRSHDLLANGRLEPAERKVPRLRLEPGAREGKAARIAVHRQSLDQRAAREAEAEQAGHFVEGFAGRVVAGAPQAPVAAVSVAQHQVAVAARDDQRHQRKRRLLRRRTDLEPVGVDVALEMIDAEQRLAPRERQAFGDVDADQQRPGQTGPWVTAIASMPSQSACAAAKASSRVGRMARRWARDACSGTTPP